MLSVEKAKSLDTKDTKLASAKMQRIVVTKSDGCTMHIEVRSAGQMVGTPWTAPWMLHLEAAEYQVAATARYVRDPWQ